MQESLYQTADAVVSLSVRLYTAWRCFRALSMQETLYTPGCRMKASNHIEIAVGFFSTGGTFPDAQETLYQTKDDALI